MTTTQTQVSTWTIDPVHSIVEFGVKHLNLTTFRGRFRTVSGTITLDEANPENSSVAAEIEVSSLDVPGERFYGHLVSDAFFHGEEHPKITFRSTRVQRKDDDHWTLAGELTMRGATRAVTLALEYLGQSTHPFSGKTVAGFRAETTIERGDFGMEWNAPMDAGAKYVGEQVRITLEIEAVRQDPEE
jgi:polyisoprenoid-binding protein YceI